MVTIQLEASFGVLCLTTNEHGWCTVKLSVGEQAYPVGSDTFVKVREKLRQCLGENLSGASNGSIEQVEVEWVMSLMEDHCSIYAGETPGGRTFFVQDANGHLLAKLVLDATQRAEWRKRLGGEGHMNQHE